MSDIRVLIAEDQTLMREGLRTILELEDGFAVAGVAADGREAVERALALRPDVVLMDVQMPHLDGVQATAQLSAALPSARVIILTTFDYDEYVFDGIKAGARGYLLKDTPASELLSVIRRVCAGESIIQPSIASRMIVEFSQRRDAPPQPEDEAISEREREVLRLLALGHTNQEIAKMLYISVRTAETHRAHIMQKLRLSTRAELVRYALAHGLLDETS
jgi:DNA-binding NarL/FixJ family response regulator